MGPHHSTASVVPMMGYGSLEDSFSSCSTEGKAKVHRGMGATRTRCPAVWAGACTAPKLGSAVGLRDMLVEISPSYSAGLYGVPVKCYRIKHSPCL